MWTTLLFSAVTIIVAVPLGFIFAWLVERTDLPHKTLAMSLLSIGILFPTFLKAMGWVFLLHPRIGVINIFLMQLFGLSQAPLNIATVAGIGFVQGLTLAPLAYVMVSAALRSMNPALVEAASVHGVASVAHLGAHQLAAHLAGAVLCGNLDVHGGDRRLRRAGRDWHGEQYFYLQHGDLFHDQSQRRIAALWFERRVRHDYGRRVAGVNDSLLHRAQTKPPVSNSFGQGLSVASGRDLASCWPLGWGLVGGYFLLAFIFPLLAIFWVSLLPYVQVPSWHALSMISFERYSSAAFDGGLLQAAGDAALLMVLVPTIIVVICAAISWIVTRSRLRWRVALDAVAFLPIPCRISCSLWRSRIWRC